MDGVPREDQDWYYPFDYIAWKSKLPVPIDDCDLLSADEQAAAWQQLLDAYEQLSGPREQLRLVFTTETLIDEWLDAPDSSLGGLSPRVVASQPGGLEQVRNLITRMVHGIP